jgi:tetratricopeptide (TPR) repeat protein
MSEPFVARQRELERLNTLLDLALAGHGQLAFVVGEAGSGKTALLREFTRRAQQAHAGLVAASGECDDLASQADPYLPFREVLAQLTGDVDKALAQGSITPDGANRLKRLLAQSGQVLVDIAPDLINVVIPGTRLVALLGKAVASRTGWLEKLDGLAHKKHAPTTIGAPSLSSDRVYEEYAAFLRRLSESQPLLIVLDDLHWSDSASAGLLFHLSRRIADRPILILGAFRPDIVAQGRNGNRHPLEPVLNEVKRYSGQGTIDLAPSTTQEARAFVDAILDAEPNGLDGTFREALCRRTEGHPIFVTELLRAMRERGDLFQDDHGRWVARPGIDWSTFPERAEGVVAERMARLDPDDLALLQPASVEGDTFIAEVVARIVDREPRQVVTALSTSLDRGHALVSGAGVRRIGEQRLSSYTFRHHMMQEYLVQAMDPAQRAYLHEDVAKALLSLCGEEDEQIIGELAWHYRQAGVADRAFHFAVLAGDRAAAAYANADAQVQYGAAVDLLSEHEASAEEVIHLYRRRGRAFELMGEPDSALATYEAMRDVGRKRRSGAIELAALAAQSALLAVPTGKHDPDEALRLATEALSMARAAGDRVAEAQILWSLLLIYRFTGRPREGLAYGEESQALARQLGLREQLAFTLHDLSMVYEILGERDDALAAAAEAGGLWVELGNQPMLANSLAHDARQVLFAGELGRAGEMAGEVVRIGTSIGNLSAMSVGRTISGLVSLEQGDIETGLDSLQEAVEAGQRGSNAYAATGVRAELAWALATCGRLEEGLAGAREATAEAERSYRSARGWTAAILVRILLLNGDLPAAEGAFTQGGVGATDNMLNDASLWGGVAIGLAAAEIEMARGDFESCHAAVDRLEGHLNKIGARLHLPEAQLLRARALLAQNHLAEARLALQEARDIVEAIGSRRILWMILDAQADVDQADGDLLASKELRRQARQEIESMAQHLGDEGHRMAFLTSPRVAAVMTEPS